MSRHSDDCSMRKMDLQCDGPYLTRSCTCDYRPKAVSQPCETAPMAEQEHYGGVPGTAANMFSFSSGPAKPTTQPSELMNQLRKAVAEAKQNAEKALERYRYYDELLFLSERNPDYVRLSELSQLLGLNR